MAAGRSLRPRPSPGRPGSDRQGGFTLLEIMLVLVIGAIMYALILAMPFGRASSADLKAAARNLASGLRQAQTLAMVTRRDALLTVDMQERKYVVTGQDKAHDMPKNIEVKLFTAQSEVESDSRGSIRFYPDGSSTGGRITVKSGERQFLVDVDWLTGRVSIGD